MPYVPPMGISRLRLGGKLPAWACFFEMPWASSTTPNLHVPLSARSSSRMGRPPLFPFHTVGAWPSSLFPMLLDRSEGLLVRTSNQLMRLRPLRLSVWRVQGNGHGLTLQLISKNGVFECVRSGRASRRFSRPKGRGFQRIPAKTECLSDGLLRQWRLVTLSSLAQRALCLISSLRSTPFG